jgi:cell division protein FtsB
MLLSRRLKTIGLMALVTAVAGVTLAFDGEGLQKYRRLRDQAEALRLENEQLALENARLSREAQALRTSPAALERAAREELRFIRPGEVIYRLDVQPGGLP